MEKKKVVIRNNYTNLPIEHDEVNSEEDLLDADGYIPAQTQVENLLLAGRNLEEYRREMYEYPDGVKEDDPPMDPSRRRGFDPVDAQHIMQDVRRKLDEAKKAKKKQNKQMEKQSDEVQERVEIQREPEKSEASEEV